MQAFMYAIFTYSYSLEYCDKLLSIVVSTLPSSLSTTEQKTLKLAMGAYVAVTEGEATTYSYMQDDEKGTLDGKYYFVSYNTIVPPQEA